MRSVNFKRMLAVIAVVGVAGAALGHRYLKLRWFTDTDTTDMTEQAVAPSFSLPDQNGATITLDALRAGGPVVLVFYRGHW